MDATGGRGGELMAKNGYSSVLDAAAMGMADPDGCCDMRDANGECCMADRAREVFKRIADAGGPSLEHAEALARGEVILARPVATEAI